MTSWESLQRRAKYLESKLESKITFYAQLAQNLDSNYHDEENPEETRQEQEFSSEIERDLNELSEIVSKMRNVTPSVPNHQHESIVKRYHEIHFDHSSEYNSIMSKIMRKRSSKELFGNRSNNRAGEKDAVMERLLSESSGIKSSMKSTNEVIGQAFEIKNSLLKQKEILNNSTSGLSNITTNIPMLDRLIDGIQKKKAKESAILAAVVGGLVCITIWWVLLR